ncbi:MAG TPA: transcriptional regulator [Beijerinckiaceae bacterium]
MEIRPIRNDDDHARAIAEIERLWGAAEGTPEGDKLDVLATLVDAYEANRWPLGSADPVEMLEFAITEMGRSQAELAEVLGSRSRASEVLGRKRALTIEMIDRISTRWHIPRDVLARPYRLVSSSAAARSGKRLPKKRRSR